MQKINLLLERLRRRVCRKMGAGLLLMYGDKILVIRRSESTPHAGKWGIPGGSRDVRETGRMESAYEAAYREAREEIGFVPPHKVIAKFRVTSTVPFTTFVATVDRPFIPQLNDEHTEWKWATPEELYNMNLIKGMRQVISRLV